MAGLYSRIIDLNHLIGVAITCHNNCAISWCHYCICREGKRRVEHVRKESPATFMGKSEARREIWWKVVIVGCKSGSELSVPPLNPYLCPKIVSSREVVEGYLFGGSAPVFSSS